MKKIYLDNAATTIIIPEVKKAMMPFFSNIFANESSSHSMGRDANKYVENARNIIAKTINSNTNEIYFTSCGSESNSWAILGIASANNSKGNHIITTKIEHDSIINSCNYLENKGYKIDYVSVDNKGDINIDELESLINEKTILISTMMVNNEVGTIQNIKKIGEIAHKHNIVFHTDAVQGFGMLNIDVKALNIDLMSVSAHKIYGPKGMGFLYIKNGIKIDNLIFGGNQEFGKRGGTANTPAIVGFGKATEIAYKNLEANYNRIFNLREYFVNELKNNFNDEIIINGNENSIVPNIVSVSFKNKDANILLMKLDQMGICVSRGSACTAGSSLPSYVLQAMGLNEYADKTIRFSLSRFTTKKELNYVIKSLNNILK